MFSVRPFFVCAAVSAPLLACGGGDEVHAKCGSSSCGSRSETLELCDGSDRLWFAGRTGGGNASGVPRVALEVGWSFLLVDGTCRYWSMTAPDGPVRTGTLDPSQESAFMEELELGEWDPAPPGPMGCPDASTTSLRFADDETSVSCASPPVMVAYDAWLETLHAAGTDLDGEARYSVADASTESWVVGNNTNLAEPWPLEGELTLLGSYVEEESAEPTIASPADAQALRAARNVYGARAYTVGPWLRVPMVLEASGAEPVYFNLAMRDVTPFERDGELAVDDFFAP